MRALGVVFVLGLTMAAVTLPATVAHHNCSYPIGYCPTTTERLQVQHCWRGWVFTQSPTETDVVAVGAKPGSTDAGLFYLWLSPVRSFLEQPSTDPLFQTTWRERNEFGGLQVELFRCGTFVWFWEEGAWMGPYSMRLIAADYRV